MLIDLQQWKQRLDNLLSKTFIKGAVEKKVDVDKVM